MKGCLVCLFVCGLRIVFVCSHRGLSWSHDVSVLELCSMEEHQGSLRAGTESECPGLRFSALLLTPPHTTCVLQVPAGKEREQLDHCDAFT